LAGYTNTIESILVPELNCTKDCLLDQVSCKEKRFKDFFKADEGLERAMLFHSALEVAGREVQRLEKLRGKRYAVVAWVRPDALPMLDGGGGIWWPPHTELLESDYDVGPCREDTSLAQRFKMA